MPRGERQDVTSKLLGVWLTDDATEGGIRVEFAVKNIVDSRVVGQTVRARNFAPKNRSFLGQLDFDVHISDPSITLAYALKAAWALDSTRDTELYMRFGTFDGDGKPNRNGKFTSPNFDHNYPDNRARELIVPFSAASGDWVAPA